MAVKMGRREDLGYPQPSAPSPPRRASRAAYGYEYGYEWYGYAYQGLWYAYCATMSHPENEHRKGPREEGYYKCYGDVDAKWIRKAENPVIHLLVRYKEQVVHKEIACRMGHAPF